MKIREKTPQKQHAQEIEALSRRLEGIRHIVMVMSGKGGVGKTTVAANLSAALAREGYSVGILDGDIHGPNIPKILGVEGRTLSGNAEGDIVPVEVAKNLRLASVGNLLENQDQPVVWRGPMKHSMLRHFLGGVAWGELDFLVVDLPPGTGDEPLSIAQLIREASVDKVPYAIVVTTPQDIALLDSRKSVEFARTLDLRLLGIIENMSTFSCPHCGHAIDLFKVGGGERAARDLGVPFLGAIPIDPTVVRDTDDGRPFMFHNMSSAAGMAFGRIVEKVLAAV
ncbi:MAG TPA: Mrp/NBP35 family ATP-binding protein [Deltaproteobacteria bacterium]|nr:Mrp/NBP35 family ATP-binding protein [Deltaproteobacteria bacterium]HOM29582.1 Mrp/NBP35 family ATP-binding protein [Deltaproteobacteria bacterium]HPP81158.1 Mrp/NBP35 family ATP-binding protein [Deltaproteobacteria bacterium]